jgi:hypothetical protein
MREDPRFKEIDALAECKSLLPVRESTKLSR